MVADEHHRTKTEAAGAVKQRKKEKRKEWSKGLQPMAQSVSSEACDIYLKRSICKVG
jgi:hypothetical protein